MTVVESLKKINTKTYVFFSVVIVLFLLIFIGISFIHYCNNKFIPVHDKIIKFTDSKNIYNRYHKEYSKQFFLYYTLKLSFENLFFISLLFFSLNYSFMINKNDLITSDGKKLLFSKIAAQGLLILSVLTVLFFLGQNFITPAIENNLKQFRNNTLQSMILLENAHKNYKLNNYREALSYYEDYVNLIGDSDREINKRIRELSNALNIEAFKQMQEKKDSSQEISDLTDDYYIDLAEYYFEKKDYYTSWYYYKFISETDTSKKIEAENRITDIKKILEYENSMKTIEDKMSLQELNYNFMQKEDDFTGIYNLKKKANDLVASENLQKAFFLYNDILQKNPNLRDIIKERENVFVRLINTSCEYSYIKNVELYPGKSNMLLLISKNKLFYAGKIIKYHTSHYFFNLKIFDLNDDYTIRNVIYSPYARTLDDNTITLYCFSKIDRNIEYKPQIFYSKDSFIEEYRPWNIELPLDIDLIYNFAYDYKLIYNLSIFQLFDLLRINNEIFKNQENIIKNKKNDCDEMCMGINIDFIKTAIPDKISEIFLFFCINLIFISFAWRLKASYLGHIPLFHYLLLPAIPAALYFFILLLKTFNTILYSILTVSFNFVGILLICFLINLVLFVFSIIYISTSS